MKPEVLVAGFSDADRDRRRSIEVLAASGADAPARLAEMLDDPSWVVRREVVAALAALGDPAVPVLCALLCSRRDEETRLAAIVDALSVSTGDADSHVIALAQNQNPAIVANAAQILGRRRSASSIPVLAHLIDHWNDNVVVAAIEALGRVGGRAAVDPLIRAVTGASFFRAFPAIDVLGRSEDVRAVAPLAGLLQNPHYALEAARALGRTGEKSAVEPLIALLERPADSVVRVAALALADLVARHERKFGSSAPVEEAMKRALGRPQIARRLSHCATGAEPAEQIAIARILGIAGGDVAIGALTRLLASTAEVAAAAAQALKRIGRDVEAQLRSVLREADSAKSLAVLPLMSSKSAAAEVIACLEDPDPAVRVAACDALARIGDPAAGAALFRVVENDTLQVLTAAVNAIQSLGSTENRALAFQAARSPAAQVRRAAMGMLAYFGDAAAIPLLCEAMGDPDERVHEAAIQALATFDSSTAASALIAAASDSTPRIRASAVRALGSVNGDDRVTDSLIRALDDTDPWVRYFGCQSLGKLGFAGAVQRISALLEDEAGQVRVAAVEALSHFDDPLARDALTAAVRSSDFDIRRAGLVGLGTARRPDSLGILAAALGSSDASTRLIAVSALAGFDTNEVVQILSPAAADPEDTVSNAAIKILGAREGPEATAALIARVSDPRTRDRAISALAIPAKGRTPAILAALEEADDELAPALTAALARMLQPDTGFNLRRVMGLRNAPARKAAAASLAALGSREDLALLQRAATDDPEPEVRRICALLLVP